MEISRRTLMRSMAVAAGVAVVPGLPGLAEAAVGQMAAATSVHTIAWSAPSTTGWRTLSNGPAETRIVRATIGAAAKSGRAARREPLLAFAHFSDVHLVDHQSPMRVEWTDRFDDPNPTGKVPGIFSSAYRAHEMLMLHVADSMVRAVNAQKVGPVTGLPLRFMMQTGDNTDNTQLNETRWNIDVMDGKQGLRPDSGDYSTYEGVMDWVDESGVPLYYDPAYWHPDGNPSGSAVDDYHANWGFPSVPGLLDTSRQPFDAVGLDIPWYSAYGNHDGLVQGNFPASTTQLNLIATGSLKIISPPAGVNSSDVLNALKNGSLDSLLSSALSGAAAAPYVRIVTADSNRQLVTRQQYVTEHFTTTGTPVGHGFTSENEQNSTAYYTFDQGIFRYVVMDTVDPNGYADGSLDQDQFTWVKSVIGAAKNKAVLLFSHHTSGTMENPLVATGGDVSPRVLGSELVSYLLTQPQVIAWVNGHTHINEIMSHSGPNGGFWEINTASHIDFPQQARLVEVANNCDGTWSIFTTVLDHNADAVWDGSQDTPQALASLARTLAVNDPQNSIPVHVGTPEDRTTELLVKAPPGLENACVTDGGGPGPTSSGAVAGGSAAGPGGRTHYPTLIDGGVSDKGSGSLMPELTSGGLAVGLGAVALGEIIRRRSERAAEAGLDDSTD